MSSPLHRANRHAGFTLVELMTGVGIASVLGALLLATLPGIMRRANEGKCVGNSTPSMQPAPRMSQTMDSGRRLTGRILRIRRLMEPIRGFTRFSCAATSQPPGDPRRSGLPVFRRVDLPGQQGKPRVALPVDLRSVSLAGKLYDDRLLGGQCRSAAGNPRRA